MLCHVLLFCNQTNSGQMCFLLNYCIHCVGLCFIQSFFFIISSALLLISVTSVVFFNLFFMFTWAVCVWVFAWQSRISAQTLDESTALTNTHTRTHTTTTSTTTTNDDNINSSRNRAQSKGKFIKILNKASFSYTGDGDKNTPPPHKIKGLSNAFSPETNFNSITVTQQT